RLTSRQAELGSGSVWWGEATDEPLIVAWPPRGFSHWLAGTHAQHSPHRKDRTDMEVSSLTNANRTAVQMRLRISKLQVSGSPFCCAANHGCPPAPSANPHD